jgi:hypothetical protein
MVDSQNKSKFAIFLVSSIILILILIVIAIVAAVYASSAPPPSVKLLPQCSTTYTPSQVFQINPDDPASICETQDGTTGTYYYLGKVSPFPYVVARSTMIPFNVCVQYCTSYQNGTCTGPNVEDKTSQQMFDQCISQLDNPTCQAPVPIAAIDSTFYFATDVTTKRCINHLNKDN